jgi:tetratricopeptide (TPR) repeat protein
MKHIRKHSPFAARSATETTDQILAAARRHHLNCRLPEAEKEYRKILNAEPNHPEALHLLGVIAHQTGYHEEAIELIGRAIQHKPEDPKYHNNLGLAFDALNEAASAKQSFQLALQLDPNYADACNNLGNSLKKAGQIDDAIEFYRRAIDLSGDMPAALLNLGTALHDRGDAEAAMDCYRQAIKSNPVDEKAFNNLGNALRDLGRIDEAIENYRRAIRINPRYLKALNNLGNALRYELRFAEAHRIFRQAIQAAPDSAESYCNHGNIFKDENRLEAALQNYQQAIRLQPDLAEAHFNCALVYLLQGKFNRGWREYEWRMHRREWKSNRISRSKLRHWNGEPFAGKRLLVYDEQGYGDTIQFVRYLPLVKARGGEVIFETRNELIDLFRKLTGIDKLVERKSCATPLRQADIYAPLLSLPGILTKTFTDIPAAVPYLSADPQKRALWKARLTGRQLNVGLVWAGNSMHLNDRQRSCNLEKFLPLIEISGVHFYSLQKGAAAEQLSDLPKKYHLTNDAQKLATFDDTAAIVANLDLIISVDTAVAHLAGAMGKPVWVLLPYACDWRWFLDREDSPWYPTMRLFRQKTPGDWEPVVSAIARHLHVLVNRQNVRENLPPAGHRAEQHYRQANQFYDQNNLPLAIAFYRKAIEARSDFFEAYFNLGKLYQDQDCLDDAIACYREALQIRPDFYQACYNMGIALYAQGKLEHAMACYQEALALKPDFAQGLNNLGLILHELRDTDRALQSYQKAIDLIPDYTEAYFNMGRTYYDRGEFGDAVQCYQTVLKLLPAHAEAHHNLGIAYQKLGKLKEAAASYRKTLQLRPDHVQTYYNMGNIFLDQGNIDEMIPWYQKALEFTPDDAAAFNNMGKILQSHGRVSDARWYYLKALQKKPDFEEARFNLSIVLLLMGDFIAGFKEYESRFNISNSTHVYPHRLEKPRWEGAPFAGYRLLVHSEQGLGDTLQFARYLPLVKARGGTLIFETAPALMDIFQDFPCIDELVQISPRAKTGVDYDFYIPLLSLARIFQTTLETVPANIPYIYADPRKTKAWRTRLNAPEFKVGIVWAGGPLHKSNVRRSCDLQKFLKLTTVSDVRLYGLQKGKAAAQLEDFSQQVSMTNYGEELETFGETAAVLANLDLIISVDTAVAHLAGAMGKPVWVLLPFQPDWRWMLERQDTPWYPTMRLFRQTKIDDWDGVLKRITAELDKSAAEHRKIISRRSEETVEVRHHTEALSTRDRRLASIKPGLAEAHLDLGNAHYQRKSYKQAIVCYQKALRHKPDFVEAHYNLANTYLNQSSLEKAAASFRKALALSPDYIDAWFNLGITFYESGSPDEAIGAYQKALSINPQMVAAHYNLGIVFQEQHNFSQAIVCYQNALELKPDFLEAYNNMGNAYQELGNEEQAICCFNKALAINPDYADAHYNLGKTYHDQFRYDAAIGCYQKAIVAKPHHHKACNNLAKTYQDLGIVEKANDWYQKALQLKPDYAEARFNLSTLQLLTGNYNEGWQGYEWRFRRRDWKITYPRRYTRPRWDGSSFVGERLFIHSEQGLGDMLQFVRYLALAKARGGTLILETLKPLMGLFENVAGIDRLVEYSAEGLPESEFDLYAPLLSLPGIFKTTPVTIPATVPYLFADPHKSALWKHRMADRGFKVGLVWAGTDTDPRRSCPLAFLGPLAEFANLHLYGLQKGIAAEQVEVEGLPQDMRMTNFGQEFENFSDTAAVIENLDLVISIDTSVAHLAGGMGKPTWLMLPYAADWRWFLESDRSPWYPTMKLFRQANPGDWQSVAQRIAEELRATM